MAARFTFKYFRGLYQPFPCSCGNKYVRFLTYEPDSREVKCAVQLVCPECQNRGPWSDMGKGRINMLKEAVERWNKYVCMPSNSMLVMPTM
jgi:hypothetical protein